MLLFLLSETIVRVFDASGEAACLIRFYTHWLVGGFMFNGMLFIANAAFNNLGRAYLATLFNFSRMLLGTVPLVYLFSRWYGAPGVLAGELGGAVVFGSLAYATLFWQIGRIEARHPTLAPAEEAVDDTVQWPFSSPRTQMSQKWTGSDR